MARPTELQAITPICPEPVRHPWMLQSWRRLTFLHWRYDPDIVQRMLPTGLEIDILDGSAWVGLVPFEIHGLRPPGMPALAWLSNFAETNVRTYAVGPDGSRGVWFFSLDAARLLAVLGARAGYGLPYFWANMRVSEQDGAVRYHSRRAGAVTDILIEPGLRLAAQDLDARDHFLTARFRLFTLLRGKLAFAPVEHDPWLLARARVSHLRETLLKAAGLGPPKGEPLVHYSEDISVKVGAARAFG